MTDQIFIVTLHMPVKASSKEDARQIANFAGQMITPLANGRKPGYPAVAVTVRDPTEVSNG